MAGVCSFVRSSSVALFLQNSCTSSALADVLLGVASKSSLTALEESKFLESIEVSDATSPFVTVHGNDIQKRPLEVSKSLFCSSKSTVAGAF